MKESLWLSLYIFTGITTALIAGTVLAFPVYSQTLKQEVSLSQTQVVVIGASANFGSFFGLHLGLLYDKYGPKWSALFGAVASFVGYGMVYLSLSKVIPTSFLLLCFYFFIAGQGGYALYTSAMMSNVKVFGPQHRGKLIGIFATFMGLSAALFIWIHDLFFDGHDAQFLLCLAVVLAVVGLWGAAFLPVPPKVAPPSNVIPNPALVKLHSVTGTKLFFEPLFLSMFFMLFIGVGSSIAYINNASSYMISRFNQKDNFPIALFSFTNALCRFPWGYMSDKLSNYVTRPTLCAIALFLQAIGLVGIAITMDKNGLTFFSMFVGLGFGALLTLIPSINSFVFGLANYGLNHACAMIGCALGVFILGLLASTIYDIKADQNNNCFGRGCYEAVFLVCAGLCIIGVMIALYLRWGLNRLNKSSAEKSPADMEMQALLPKHAGDSQAGQR